jgi:beta-lactam-binding protein with PASTA domain
MYYQQSSAKVFWISFLTSLIVSSLIGFTFVYFIPEVLSGKSKMVEIPDVENLELHKAEMIMDERGLKIIVEDEKFHPTTKKNRVIYQKPTAGETVEKGSTVRVVLSKGPEEGKEEESTEEVIVPSVIGFDINQAKVYLSERGLNVGVVERQESEEAKDVVLKTIPEPGQKVTEAVPIKLIVSSGGGKVAVPNLRGKSEYRARTLLEESGLELGRRNYITSGEHAFDIIIGQSPEPGVMIEKGSKVDITINREGR